jgi:uncharacterized cupin superfamily protein
VEVRLGRGLGVNVMVPVGEGRGSILVGVEVSVQAGDKVGVDAGNAVGQTHPLIEKTGSAMLIKR